VNLTKLIKKAIRLKETAKAPKTGDDVQFALGFDTKWWVAEIGNPCSAVRLGESVGEYCGEGKTAKEAVKALIHRLEGDQK
jgi:hypothetical protein